MPTSSNKEPELNEIIAQAVALHTEGMLEQAKELYEKVIAVDKENFDALHLFGVVYGQQMRACN
jgi:hypothetical protein